MKGLILAAGRGTRLRPLTHTRPKPAIRVAGRPIIHYAVENLLEAGVREIGVVVSPETERDLKALAGKVVQNPERTDIDANLHEQLIVEFYSR